MQRKLAAGDILFEKGCSASCVYLISRGEIGLYRDQAGIIDLIERRGIGATLGDTAVLLQREHSVTARAEAPSTVFEVPSDRVLQSLDRIDPVLQSCITTTLRIVAGDHGKSAHAAQISDQAAGQIDLLLERLDLEEDLLNGLADDEFYVAYQPIVDLQKGNVAGFEALMRWNHPKRGHVRPDIFISAAEDIGAIWQITQLALTKTCETLCRCQKLAKHRLFAAVNISARDVARDEFVEFLNHTLDRHGLGPEDIKLELTETALLPKTPTALDNLDRMRALGFGLSVDDFGTGYSNLGYLQVLPIKTLKIDRIFSNGAHANSIAQSIVRALVALGKDLNVEIVAEGVEDQADVQALENLGCRFVQGFYFHKPMVEDRLFGLLEDAGTAVA
jgi:EAL domain-containing protein (putative c-di-GMP-specific phosphodiesterase class I)